MASYKDQVLLSLECLHQPNLKTAISRLTTTIFLTMDKIYSLCEEFMKKT